MEFLAFEATIWFSLEEVLDEPGRSAISTAFLGNLEAQGEGKKWILYFKLVFDVGFVATGAKLYLPFLRRNKGILS